MWPFRKEPKPGLPEGKWPNRGMRCGTPYIQSQLGNPTFCIRSIYEQADGSTIIEDHYPYDGRREARVEPKGFKS
jgi:hypothetical protein